MRVVAGCSSSNSPYAEELQVLAPEDLELPARCDVEVARAGDLRIVRLLPDDSKPLIAVIPGRLVRVHTGAAVPVVAMYGRHNGLEVIAAKEGTVITYEGGYKYRSEHHVQIGAGNLRELNVVELAQVLECSERPLATLEEKLRAAGVV